MTLDVFYQQQQNILHTGLCVLLCWAIFNIFLGGILMFKTENEQQQFQRMNFFWNLVNLIIAGYSLLFFETETLKNDLLKNETAKIYILKKQHFLETIFLVNTALDLVYIVFGLYLSECAKTAKNLISCERNTGFGQSLCLQGGFLFVFDLVMFYMIWQHGKIFGL